MAQKFAKHDYQTILDGENVGPSIVKRLARRPIGTFFLTENNNQIMAGNKFTWPERSELPGPVQNRQEFFDAIDASERATFLQRRRTIHDPFDILGAKGQKALDVVVRKSIIHRFGNLE